MASVCVLLHPAPLHCVCKHICSFCQINPHSNAISQSNYPDTELLNTAVLTGKKVSMALRTVAVGADGLITDVSNLTQCGSTDEEVLKKCNSVGLPLVYNPWMTNSNTSPLTLLHTTQQPHFHSQSSSAAVIHQVCGAHCALMEGFTAQRRGRLRKALPGAAQETVHQDHRQQVSDRCDYVFVNGKETKGRVRVAVNFTYGHLSAQLEMTVWMPRLPLQIEVSDPELSQVKGWRVPVPAGKRSSWESEEDEDRKGKGCMLQYQHALVKVFTQFLADQLDPQLPPAYFLGADWQVDVTKLVRSSLKVENTRVARLQAGRVLLGRGIGVTTVKVLSPLSDSVLGERTVKVLDDKVSITELGVQLVSGLSLSLQLSPGSNRAIVAMATMQEVLQNPKQEAVVGCWVQFSDGSVMPLDVYDSSSYMLTVTSLDKAVASVRGSPPRVMAERQGQGSLVRVEMGISEACQKSKRKSSLAVGHGDLRVTFQPSGLLFSGGGNGQEPVTEARTQRPLIRGSPTEREGHLLVSSVSQASSWRFRTTTTSPVPNMVSVSTVRDREADRELTSTNKASSSTSESSTTIGGPRSSTGGRASSILGGVSSTTSRASSNVGGASSNVGGVRHGWGGVISNMGGASNSLGVVSSSLGGVSSPVYDGGMVSIAAAGANTLDYSNVPSQVEVPKWSTPVEVESDMVQTSRFPSNLEIGMYALLGVLCLAILVFLLNCISYLMGTRHKKPPAQCQEPGNHRHNWVWLGTEADRAINGPVTPPQPESHAAIAINIDVAPGMGMVGMGKSATLGRRTSAPPSMDPLLGRRGSLQAKPTRGESLHSPTSKRKRVQFTTFSSLDNPHYSTLPGMHWATKVQNFTERHGAFQESLYANLPYEPKPMQ
ncbi:hypothetical protein JZ751_012062 [Albula glossodonta]|uniref:Transmembrane protein 132D n=1 Tax=Albula glossodonta TaxID=121402 RepID=A0A8T2PRI3_9TELE|nr:hypothetical protein JZ751_012062 [Albula glossodonta]